jgi:ABC-type Zn uptake system ZnuABC Zn-binding protein ZnuA
MLGLEMEAGWAPPLWEAARNPKVLPGSVGFVDASHVIRPLQVPGAQADRSMGDLHAMGNPHYLLDPLNGLRVAALLAEAFTRLRPEAAERFAARLASFRERLGSELFGAVLAKKYDVLKLGVLQEHGRLESFLESQGESAALGGWTKTLAPFRGKKAVADHQLWPYFAQRFGIEVVGYMEPKPGIPPTTKHLAEVVKLMQAQEVKVILAAPYYDPRHAEFLAERTGAAIVPMAHAVASREGTDDYLALCDYNVRVLAEGLAKP